jgi:hypothetical protein
MKTAWSYLLIGIKAIAKFLHFTYASEITIAVLAVLIGLFYSGLVGCILFIWGVGLFINQLKQNQK